VPGPRERAALSHESGNLGKAAIPAAHGFSGQSGVHRDRKSLRDGYKIRRDRAPLALCLPDESRAD